MTDLLLRDQDLLPKMKKAGVFLICLGVESAFGQDLKYYDKGTSLQKARKAVALVKKHGIHAWCFLMIGNSSQSQQDVLDILRYAKELDPTIAFFSARIHGPAHQVNRARTARYFTWRPSTPC